VSPRGEEIIEMFVHCAFSLPPTNNQAPKAYVTGYEYWCFIRYISINSCLKSTEFYSIKNNLKKLIEKEKCSLFPSYKTTVKIRFYPMTMAITLAHRPLTVTRTLRDGHG